MPGFNPEQSEQIRERDALLARPDAVHLTLKAGARVDFGGTSITFVSAARENFSWGMCGSNVFIRVVLKIAQGACKPIKVEVGPRPVVAKAAGLSITLDDESTPQSIHLIVA